MDLPQTLDRRRNVELASRSLEPWVRRAVLVVLAAVAAAGLADVFGQRPTAATASAPEATLRVEVPSALRGGLVYQARFEIRARQELAKPALVLASGWFEGVTTNSVQPEPLDWAEEDGRVVLTFGRLPAGERLVVRIQAQVNPTAVGGRRQDVALDDGARRLLVLRRTAIIYP